MHRAALIMLLLLGLGQAPAMAAEAPAEETPPVQNAETGAASESGGSTANRPVDEALAEEIRAAEQAQATAAPSNEPFIPTVQISEDLSVSFPVDI